MNRKADTMATILLMNPDQLLKMLELVLFLDHESFYISERAPRIVGVATLAIPVNSDQTEKRVAKFRGKSAEAR